MTSTVAPPKPPAATKAAAGAGIALVLVAQLMIVLDAAVVNVALPRIADDLEFTPAALTWVLNGYTLAFGGLLLLGGRLGDVFGRRRMFVAGLSVFTLFSLAGGFAPTDELLVIARALQGFGAAIAAPQVLALLTTSAKDEAGRARAIALFSAVSSSGASIGLILGGILTDIASWRWTLFINVPIGLVVLALVGRLVAETAPRPGRFDIVGAVTATGGAAAIVWSLIGAPEHGWTSARTLGGIAIGLLLLVALVLTERRVAHPLLQLHLFNSHRRVAAFIAAVGLVGAQFATFYLTVIYLQGVLGMGPLASGLAFLPLTLMIFAMSRVAPRIAARIGMSRGAGPGCHRPHGVVPVAEHALGDQHVRRRRPGSVPAQRCLRLARLHLHDGSRPGGCRRRPRRLGLGSGADDAAARRLDRPGRDRLRLRRQRHPRRGRTRDARGLLRRGCPRHSRHHRLAERGAPATLRDAFVRCRAGRGSRPSELIRHRTRTARLANASRADSYTWVRRKPSRPAR